MSEPSQPKSSHLLGTFVKFCIICGVLLSGVWLMMGRSALEKVVTALVMPCGLIWYCLSFAVFLAYGSRQKGVTACIAITWLMYTAMGNGYVCRILTNQIESDFQQIQPLDQQPFETVVVLGGGASAGVNLRQQGNSAGDRLILAAQLYHQGLTKRLICTGKRIKELTNVDFDPAEQSRDVLVKLGVPAEAIEMVGGRNTSEEMQTLGSRFQDKDVRVGLVTSAWHLRRATRLASKSGFQPTPLPADFVSGPRTPLTLAERIISLVPSADCLLTNTKISHEYLGALVGR